jgi:hypothetical protein
LVLGACGVFLALGFRFWGGSGEALREKGLMGWVFLGRGLQAEAAENPGVKALPGTGQQDRRPGELFYRERRKESRRWAIS